MTFIMRITIAAAIVTIALGLGSAIVSLDAQPRSFKVAFYNIRSGKGSQPLRGKPAASFAESNSCAGSDRSLNAWGTGVVQQELATRIKNDASVLALGLAEAWACASPKDVLAVLGWKGRSDERNGTAVLARFGFAHREQWTKLDTSHNKNPRDEMWVVRAEVCMNGPCSEALEVYVTHWSGTGADAQATYDRQAQDTVKLMAESRGPHVLLGDLNVFEGTAPVCGQTPNNKTLNILRSAGYVDAWTAVHGTAEGYTGMLNRAGCGAPEGYPWKRIDYAWSKGLTPVDMWRFGVVPPGYAAPSDHFGIIVQYR